MNPVPNNVPSTKTWPSAGAGDLAADRLACFQMECETGAIRFFFFFFVVAGFAFRLGIRSGAFPFSYQKMSNGSKRFFLNRSHAEQTDAPQPGARSCHDHRFRSG